MLSNMMLKMTLTILTVLVVTFSAFNGVGVEALDGDEMADRTVRVRRHLGDYYQMFRDCDCAMSMSSDVCAEYKGQKEDMSACEIECLKKNKITSKKTLCI